MICVHTGLMVQQEPFTSQCNKVLLPGLFECIKQKPPYKVNLREYSLDLTLVNKCKRLTTAHNILAKRIECHYNFRHFRKPKKNKCNKLRFESVVDQSKFKHRLLCIIIELQKAQMRLRIIRRNELRNKTKTI